MSAHTADPHRLGHGHGHGKEPGYNAAGPDEHGHFDKRIITGYGFWIFLLSDIVMFSALFATYAVMAHATAGGPSGRQIFDLPNVAWETALLLASSFTCGLGAVAAERKQLLWAEIALAITGVLGFGFLLLEIREFADLIAQGYGPSRSGFLSAFFTLVGCHGLHVGCGLLWLGTMMAQLWAKGFRPEILRRLMCFNLFWHALDIIWVAVFTIVYLLGAMT